MILVDYILIVQRQVRVEGNPNEVASTRYVDQAELAAMINDPSVKLTPWFRLITTGAIDPSAKKGIFLQLPSSIIVTHKMQMVYLINGGLT